MIAQQMLAPDPHHSESEDVVMGSGGDDKMETEMIGHIRKVSPEVHIAEVDGPPRVTEEGKKWGLNAEEAMDLTTCWDLPKAGHRNKAWEYIKRVEIKLVIGNPMCTMFSILRPLTPWHSKKQEKMFEAEPHIKLMVAVCRLQLREGR